MNRVVIDTAALHLEIDPTLGAGIADFSLRRADGGLVPLMRRAPDRPRWFNDLACYTLVPWCNRIAGARFSIRGRGHTLRPDWPDGTAIHGDAKHRAWRVLDRSPVAARFGIDSRDFADANWPWPYGATIRYDLFDDALAIDLTVRNLGAEPMPAGLGLHPFWMRRLWSGDDDAVVRFDAAGRYPATGMIPTGPAAAEDLSRRFASGTTLEGLDLDDVFACASATRESGERPWGSIAWPGSGVRLEIGSSPAFGHAVVYSPPAPDGGAAPREWFCLEPVSMVNDGFNLMERGQAGTGVVVLEPGQAITGRVEFRVARERGGMGRLG